MGEPSELERMGDRGRRDTTIAPPMPVAAETEMGTWIFLVKYDKHPSIGWQHRLAAKGGPCFLVGKETVTGGLKVFERFPHTEEGWVQAWHFLVKLDNTLEGELRAKLAARSAADSARAAVKELDSRTQALVKSVVLLGGYLADEDMPVGKPYDLRFLNKRLLVTAAGSTEPLIDIHYGDVEDLEIGGPGVVSRLSRGQQARMTVAFGLIGAALAYSDTKIQTVVRLRVPRGDLYFLDSATVPDALRIQLARPLGEIRQARAAEADSAGHASKAAGMVTELKELASMLEAGLITREEFDRLKTKLLAG
jgi:Short C-terminal domain